MVSTRMFGLLLAACLAVATVPLPALAGGSDLFPVKYGEGDRLLSAFCNRRGEVVIGNLRSPSPFSEGWARVLLPTGDDRKSAWGYLTAEGKVALALPPNAYKMTHDFHDGMARVESWDDRTGFIDRTGKLVVPTELYQARDFREGVAWVQRTKGEAWQAISPSGERLFPQITFRFPPGDFHEGVAFVGLSSIGEACFIDKTGKPAVKLGQPPLVTAEAGPFSEGLAFVSCGDLDRCGFYDKQGKLAIPARRTINHQAVGFFREGLAPVAEFKEPWIARWGYVDKTGAMVIPFQFKKAFAFRDGRALVETTEGRWHFIDKTGAPVLRDVLDKDSGGGGGRPKSSITDPTLDIEFRNGLAWVRDELVDVDGTVVFDPAAVRYAPGAVLDVRAPEPVKGPLVLAAPPTSPVARPTSPIFPAAYPDAGGKTIFGYFDRTGALVRPGLGEAGAFVDGLARFKLEYGNDFGYLGHDGNDVIKPSFSYASSFGEGLAAVGIFKGSKCLWGFIDPKGAWVVPAKYDRAQDFSEGLAWVRPTPYASYEAIDKSGATVVTLPNQKILHPRPFSSGFAAIGPRAKPDDALYVDRTGKPLPLPRGPVSVGDFVDGVAWIDIPGKHGLYDTTGKLVFSAEERFKPSDFRKGPRRFAEGLMAVRDMKNEKADAWGFIDRTGALVIPCRFDEVYDFAFGRALVRQGSTWSYIDRAGKVVIADADPGSKSGYYTLYRQGFVDGVAFVQQKYVDLDGKVLFDPKAPIKKATGAPAPLAQTLPRSGSPRTTGNTVDATPTPATGNTIDATPGPATGNTVDATPGPATGNTVDATPGPATKTTIQPAPPSGTGAGATGERDGAPDAPVRVSLPAPEPRTPLKGRWLEISGTSFHDSETVTVRLAKREGLSEGAWVALVPSSTPHGSEAQVDAADVTYRYVRDLVDGAGSFGPPHLVPGSFDVRLVDRGKELDSLSFEVAISGAGCGLDLPRRLYHPGQDMSLAVTPPSVFSREAWVALLPADAPFATTEQADQSDITYRYLHDLGTGSWNLVAPSTPGRYAFRLLDRRPLVSVEFEVAFRQDGIEARLESSTVEPGKEVVLHFGYPDYLSRQCWWGLVPASVAHGQEAVVDQADVAYTYLHQRPDGVWKFPAPAKAGSWEIRLLDRGLEVMALPLEVAPR